MWLDFLELLSNKQVMAGAGDVISTNVKDNSDKRGLGVGVSMGMLFNIGADAGDTGDETYTFIVEVATDSAFTVPIEHVKVTVDRAKLLTGFQFLLLFPKNFEDERFYRVKYTMAGTTPTLTVSARLSPADFVQAWTPYPIGYKVGK